VKKACGEGNKFVITSSKPEAVEIVARKNSTKVRWSLGRSRIEEVIEEEQGNPPLPVKNERRGG